MITENVVRPVPQGPGNSVVSNHTRTRETADMQLDLDLDLDVDLDVDVDLPKQAAGFGAEGLLRVARLTKKVQV
jgi:hypothetical protein